MTTDWPVNLSQRLCLDLADVALVATDSSRVEASGHGEPPIRAAVHDQPGGTTRVRAHANPALRSNLRGLEGHDMERFPLAGWDPSGPCLQGDTSNGRY
ncbi:hypothetical protein [Arthrobacter sp. B1805]|uniref:hypothetical protein n=1 Tax=Arthrobacter sp. B1805 TaxID=2058892 RepID=UPI000CE55382|nr:hypothetical protein [Arthrobacter sp. B1805]